MQPIPLTSDERLLVDALQISPRASWATVGSILGITAVTAARRWESLTRRGQAWVTASPGPAAAGSQAIAFIDITCRPAFRNRVAAAIAKHALAATVEVTSGSADVFVTAAAPNHATLSHYLLQHLDQIPHVLSSRVRFVTGIYSEGSRWRIRELPTEAVHRLERSRELSDADSAEADASTDSDPTLSAATRAMLTCLTNDGRASFMELGAAAGTSPSTARRHLARLVQTGVVRLRTDVNVAAAGWPVCVYLWANAPVEMLTETARILSQITQSRLTATATGGPSLVLCAWLRNVEDVHRLELSIAKRLPEVVIVDRLVVLRGVKRSGRLLNEDGDMMGLLPLELWDNAPHHETEEFSLEAVTEADALEA